MTHRLLIVDDEPLARETLRALVSADPEIEVVGEAADGRSAAAAIAERRPDIVLLDIEMPGQSGMQAVAPLADEPLPVFIFVTAYDRYALQAFALQALDYVLKPVSEERLHQALERAKGRVLELRLSAAARQVVAGPAPASEPAGRAALPTPRASLEAPARGYLERIPIRSQGRTRILKTRDLLWIESQDYYVRLHTRAASPLVRVALSTLERRLDPERFLRIHRGAIVHLEAVVEVLSLFKGRKALVLSEGTELKVSRSRRKAVEEVLLPRLAR